MLAVFFALKAFLKAREGVSVLILSDNMLVVAHINKMGGTRSQRLVEVTERMFAWCLQRRIRLQAQHLPGKANITVEFLSRHLRDRTDWVLSANIFRAINLTWGPLQLDLFATRFSAQLRRFSVGGRIPRQRQQMPFLRIGPQYGVSHPHHGA